MILIAVADYPDDSGNKAEMYVHTRNKVYKEEGISFSVLNFRTERNYYYDGVEVICLDEYKKNKEKYDILISHAPNIRNHFRFLMKYRKYFRKLFFFFHGHEVLRTQKVYPKPYEYMEHSATKSNLIDLYDVIKLKIWKIFYYRNYKDSYFIFVSEWMKRQFFKTIDIKDNDFNNKVYVIYNAVGKVFEKKKYTPEETLKYDFITIRGNLDNSKYSVDIVNRIAKDNPKYKFLIVGKGIFFSHIEKASNLDWLDKTLNHNEIIAILNQSKYGLMPTRTDSQGLMMCEMAAYGIPVITSNIEVCLEVFKDYNNVFFINNDEKHYNMTLFLQEIAEKVVINNIDERYYEKNTVKKEIDLIKSQIKKG